MRGSSARTILVIVMDLLIAWALAVTLRLGVEFFGEIASQGWGEAVVTFTRGLVVPFGFHVVKTPYGGVFDVDAVVMVGVILVVEWVLSGIRDRA